MVGMSIDASAVFALSRDIAAAVARVPAEGRQIVSKGALNVKKQQQAEMAASTHFKGIARSITYDLSGGAAFCEAQIGPKSGAGSPGNLANIAYFGGSRGGGTVPDPRVALEAEAPGFFAAVEAMAAKALG